MIALMAFEKVAEGFRALASKSRSARRDFLMGLARDAAAAPGMKEYEPLSMLVRRYGDQESVRQFVIDTVKRSVEKGGEKGGERDGERDGRADLILRLSDLAADKEEISFAKKLAGLGADCILASVRCKMDEEPELYHALYGIAGQQGYPEEVFRACAIQEISKRMRVHNLEASYPVLQEKVLNVAQGVIGYEVPQPRKADILPFRRTIS